jgi:hypothetical protein
MLSLAHRRRGLPPRAPRRSLSKAALGLNQPTTAWLVAIHGVGGEEVVHGILDIMYAKAPYTTLQRAVHIHPTVSELIPTILTFLARPLPFRGGQSTMSSIFFASSKSLSVVPLAA